MSKLSFGSKHPIASKVIVATGVVAALIFSRHCTQPSKQPEKNCYEKDLISVVCPAPIAEAQNTMACVDKNGMIGLKDGRKVDPKDPKMQVGMKVSPIEGTRGLYGVQLETPAGTNGYVKLGSCQ